MEKQESLQKKFGKLFDTIAHIPQKFSDAVEEGLKESSNLICVKNGLLDFDLVEDDIRYIHRNLKAKGDKVLGSRLILDDENNLMEIRTYTEKNNQNFLVSVDVEVKEIINIPENILNELNNSGRVELTIKL
ncbi:MAG: hypothetical protein IGQ45_02965 [Cyanobacterium sp. T60_A2020_053]|nr:hypothetical protein [Cyanobacterium sp. T60_A2020_053]